MTDFYIDPEGGNDTNNGTTFALRKKSLASVTGYAAGDTIKVIASREPGLLGNAQWTDNSNAIAIPAGTVKVIDDMTATTGWTPSTNITLSVATQYRLPPGSLNVLPATAFTTGKAAYKTLGAPMDLSAFQVISMSVMMNTAAASGFWQLRLCSDTLGDVPVVTIPITLRQGGTFVNFSTSYFFPLQFDNGAALPSNINSISLYCPADPGTGYIRVNNLIACKAYDDPLHLSLASIIGKNTAQEPEWYPIRYITATTVQLGNYAFSSSTEGRPYRGVTESVPTYGRIPCLYPWSSTERALAAGAGTINNYVKISGGWSRADMATQTGETFINGLGTHLPYMIDLGARNYIEVSKINPVAFSDGTNGPVVFSNPNGTRITHSHVVGCNNAVNAVTSHKGPLEINLGNVVNCQGQVDITSTNGPADYRLTARRLTGGSNNGLAGIRWNCSERLIPKLDIKRIDNFGGVGLVPQLGHISLKGTKFDNNVTADVQMNGNARAEIDNGQFLSTTPFITTSMALSELRLSNINGDATKHAYYIGSDAKFESDTTVLDTGSTMSWKMTLTASLYSAASPLAVPLMTFAFNANKLVTVTARIRRSDITAGGGIRVAANSLYGINSDVVAWASGAANAFETVTLTFTPTKAGVIAADALGWQDVANPVIYFDNFTVTQAA
jgi:hypothetical protein